MKKRQAGKAISEKAELLAKVVVHTASIYQDIKLTEKQRNMLQTIIGAGIFYISSDMKLYSGKISKAALEQLKSDPKTKLVKEHAYPRKIAGKHLYEKHIDLLNKDTAAMEKLFTEEMGRYNFVLKPENDRLRKHQKAARFTTEEAAYRAAGIEMTELSMEEYYALRGKRKRDENL